MGRFGRLFAASLLLVPVLPALPAGAQIPPAPNASVEDVSASEGNGSTTPFTFTITLDRPLAPTESVTIDYETVDESATTADGDYLELVGAVTMTSDHNGTTTASTTVEVLVEGDGRDEGAEEFTLELTGCAGCNGTPTSATATIQDDDPYVTIDGPVTAEGADTIFTVGLTEAISEDVDVELTIGDGSATEGEDYAAPTSKVITIPTGATSVPVAFPTTEDGTAEGCETLTATVDSVTSEDTSVGSPSATTATAVITDQSSAAIPCLTVGDATAVEGNGPEHTTAQVPITIAPATTTAVVVDYATVDDTAAQYLEFLPETDRQLSIPAGSTSATIPITVLGDRVDELTESFTVDLQQPTDEEGNPEQNLSMPAKGTDTERASARVRITDDDDGAPRHGLQAVSVCVDDPASRPEGNPGETPTMTFQVRVMDHSCSGTEGAAQVQTLEPVVIEYTTSDGEAQDGSTDSEDEGTGGDYAAHPPVGSDEDPPLLVVPAGSDGSTIDVTLVGDDKHEDVETFGLTLGAILADSMEMSQETTAADAATGTITNDDPIPNVTTSDVSDTEGDAFAKAFDLVVELSNPSSEDLEFTYSTADGTATADEDYQPRSQEAITVIAGQRAATATILVEPDSVEEPDETFFAILDTEAPPDGATIVEATGTITILNDDGPAFSVADASVTEGDGFGTTAMSFTVTLEPARDGEPTSVDYTTRPANSLRADEEAAVAGEDYHATSGTIEFAPGQTETTIDVPVVGDARFESNQIFEVELSDPVNAIIHDGQATGMIIDDDEDAEDGAPRAVIDGPTSGTEGDAVAFDASASFDPDGEIVEYAWAFDDGGGSARGQTVEHTFRDDGTLTVGLRITDDDGKQTTATHEVRVANAPPTPTITVGDVREVASEVTFAGGGSDPGGDSLAGFSWEFGDGGTASGQQVAHSYQQPGTYEVTLHVTDEDGATGTRTTTLEVGPDSGEVHRVAGPDRYETSVAASQEGWETATDVVLATGENFADALAAGPLAAALDAPMLLTPTASLHPTVAEELTRLGVGRVWIMGGTAAVSQAVQDQLVADGYEVERFAGPDRFSTAAIVAAGLGPSDDGEVLLALGAHSDPNRAFPDSLSAGTLSIRDGGPPVLLTAPEVLPGATKKALGFMQPTKVTLIGGEAAISAGVADELTGAGFEVRRLAGANRYATSAVVTADALEHHESFVVPVVFATGHNFPDGLSAAPLAAHLGGVLVLVPGTGSIEDTPSLRVLLAENAQRFDVGIAIGGTAVITEDVAAQVAATTQGT